MGSKRVGHDWVTKHASTHAILRKGLEHLQIWISTGSGSQLPSDIKRWLYFKVNEQTIHYSSLHWIKSINLFILFLLLTFIWCPVKSVVYLLIWQWPKTECALGGNQKRHKAGLHTGFQRRRTSRFFWCFYTLISTTLSLNCTVLGLKQRNPDSKSQSWGPGNNSHTRRTFVWWRKSTACWGSHCPRKAGTGSPKGLGPAVAAATVAGAPGRFTTAAARQLPPELADTPKMQSMLEASLEVTSRDRANLEDEVQDWKKVRQLTSQAHAASQENLEQLRERSNALIRSQVELRIKDLESELSMMNIFQKDSNQAELEKYKQLYLEELEVKKSSANKLDKTKEKLAEVSTKLGMDKQQDRSCLSTLTRRPVLESPCVGNFNNTLVLNRNLTPRANVLLSTSIPRPSNNSMETYLTKMQWELRKNITKELEKAVAEFKSGSYRVSLLGSTDESNLYQDLLLKTSQEYVHILKEKNMIWKINSKSFPTGLFSWHFSCFPLNIMRKSLLKGNVFVCIMKIYMIFLAMLLCF